MRRPARLTMAVCAMSMAWALTAQAQSPPPGPRVMPTPRVHGMQSYYQRQLQQVDQMIRLGYFSRAHALMQDLDGLGIPEVELRTRRIDIALGVGDHEQAAALCREALADRPDDAAMWRQLATALAAVGDTSGARGAIDRFLALAPEPKAGFAAGVDILRRAGDHTGAVALIDSARTVVGDPLLLANPRAVSLLRIGRPEDAAEEAAAEVQGNPYNLQLLRQDLLGEDGPPLSPAFTQAMARQADTPGAPLEVALLAANVMLAQGRGGAALHLVLPRMAGTAGARAALGNAGILAQELPLLLDRDEQQAVTDYLLAVLPVVARQPGLPSRLRQRALDSLAETCGYALDHDLLSESPAAAAARFGDLLGDVRDGHPESEHLYAAQIRLARFTRDRLRDPQAAAARLENLLLDLDLPLEGVALARLALGESYLAARDTIRARQVLTALGRDTEFSAPAGHAHFVLAKLDLAQGHLGTARDRFAAVALDNPSAPYANDALEMGLIVAEELQNPTGGPDLLGRYARAVWWELAAEPDSQRVALGRYIERASVQLDLSEQQPLLERARLQLAVLERTAGHGDAALDQLARIVADHPDGRLAPQALVLSADILADDRGDRDGARRHLERLLVQYPDYLFATEVRQRLGALP
jgi:hypothetical protein